MRRKAADWRVSLEFEPGLVSGNPTAFQEQRLVTVMASPGFAVLLLNVG